MARKLKVRPSSAPQFMRCPGSVALQAKLPKRESDFANEGSAAHHLAEFVNKKFATYEKLKGWWIVRIGNIWEILSAPKAAEKKGPKFEITDEMITNVSVYTDWCASVGGKKAYEQKLDGNWLYPGLSGTADFVSIDGSTLIVGDLKYGAGVAIYPEENEQAMLYALMALGEAPDPAITEIKIVIIQPRYNGEEKVREWTIPADALEDWMLSKLLTAFTAVNSDDPPLNPGEKQCQFCEAKRLNKCPARMEVVANTTGMSLLSPVSEPKLPDPHKLTPEDISRILACAPVVTDWLSTIQGIAEEMAKQGTPIPGYKLVRKVTRRKIRDEVEVAKAFGRDAYKKVLKTLTELEKEFGKKAVDPLCIKPEGELTLAPVTDKRPEVSTTSALELLIEDI